MVRTICKVWLAGERADGRYQEPSLTAFETEALLHILNIRGPLSPMTEIRGPSKVHVSYQKEQEAPSLTVQRMKSFSNGLS